MDHSVCSSIVHLYHVAPRSFATDGYEGPGEVLGDGDLLPGPCNDGVGPRGEGGGQNEAGGHVSEQGGLQGGGAGQQLLQHGGGQQVEGGVSWSEDCDGVGPGESLHQPGRPHGRDEAGEGRVDRQRVKHRAGQPARPWRDLELEGGGGGGAGREELAREAKSTKWTSKSSKWKLRLGVCGLEAEGGQEGDRDYH